MLHDMTFSSRISGGPERTHSWSPALVPVTRGGLGGVTGTSGCCYGIGPRSCYGVPLRTSSSRYSKHSRVGGVGFSLQGLWLWFEGETEVASASYD